MSGGGAGGGGGGAGGGGGDGSSFFVVVVVKTAFPALGINKKKNTLTVHSIKRAGIIRTRSVVKFANGNRCTDIWRYHLCILRKSFGKSFCPENTEIRRR